MCAVPRRADFMQVVVTWDFTKLFFSTFLNNSKGTYNIGNYHMRAISVAKSLYLGSFSDTLKEMFLSDGMATSIRVNLFSRSFLITMSGQFIVINSIIVAIIIFIIIISTVTTFADVLFVLQPGCKPCS